MKIQADIGIGKLPDISYIQATYYFQGCADINYKYITLLSYVSWLNSHAKSYDLMF